jgi:LDH2 family malate/lactate/ureidoglycolate dehydrogenase
MKMSEPYTIQAAALSEFAASILERAGAPRDQAVDAADVLVWANLCGIDTHGVRNLKRFYVDPLTSGRINAQPDFRVEFSTPVSARVDGDNGLGLVGGCWAMRYAINQAKYAGICLVTMHNSHHFGAAGYYPLMTVSHDMIGLSMTGRLFAEGSKTGVLPTFGTQPLLSTNPLSFSFPTAEEAPFLLDMATSITPYNRVEMMMQAGESIPLGWGLDGQGRPTTDPGALRHLFPLGGSREQGGHKGFGLALLVEILSAVLSGGWSNDGPEAKTMDDNQYTQSKDAHFFGAIRIDAFRDANHFKRDMDALIRKVHAAPTMDGHNRVYVPGEIEHETRQKRLQDGIPLPTTVVESLQELSTEYHVPLSLAG